MKCTCTYIACEKTRERGAMSVQRRNTRQRAMVLEAVRNHDDHPTADDIYLDIRQIDNKISRGTVYRNLNLLEETGQISSVRTEGGNRFDWRVDGHSHLICRRCGRVTDVSLPYIEEFDRDVEARSEFTDITHTTIFHGICPRCAAERDR